MLLLYPHYLKLISPILVFPLKSLLLLVLLLVVLLLLQLSLPLLVHLLLTPHLILHHELLILLFAGAVLRVLI